MATKISDVIVPSVFNPYIQVRTPELSALFQSGIVSNDPTLQALAASGGTLLNMPYWNDLTGSSEVLSDSGALTVNKINASQDISVLHMRGKAWGANDLAKALSGEDPMRVIGDLVAAYWSREWQSILVSALKGVFAAASMANAVLDVADEDGNNVATRKLIDGDTVVDAVNLLGDASSNLTAIAMHSKVKSTLEKQNLITFVRNSDNTLDFPTYLGKQVIVDDGLPVEAGATSGFKYTTYFFGLGAIGLAFGGAPVPTETDRDSLAGEDILINRQHFILHPRGVKWIGTPSGASPSNVELAVGTNWERVYEQKNVRIVKLVTNG